MALKIPQAEVLLDPESRRRFIRKARAAASLDHPNLVPLYEAGEVGPVCYLASAYCEGPTLAAWLRDRKVPVSPRMAARLMAPLVDAMHHAHERGVLHRDLKPSNILLHRPGPDRGGDRKMIRSRGRARFHSQVRHPRARRWTTTRGLGPDHRLRAGPTHGSGSRGGNGQLRGDGLGPIHGVPSRSRARGEPGDRCLRPGGDPLFHAVRPAAASRRQRPGHPASRCGGRTPPHFDFRRDIPATLRRSV